MTIAVRYFSRSGNTRKVADAIAATVGVTAKDCSASLEGSVDLLFLGGSVYGGDVDQNLAGFIAALDPAKVKCVACFGTSALKKEPEQEIEKLVRNRNIPVSGHSFHCRGVFTLLHRSHPNDADLKRAADFAAAAVADAQ